MVQKNGVPVGMKHYPAEFKADAVALYRSRPGATIKSVATDLGVNTETLRNWIRAADGRRSGAHWTRTQTVTGNKPTTISTASTPRPSSSAYSVTAESSDRADPQR
ncbi:transposase [Streptomyces sp. NPDC057908]|uniref:transposase n=2 Tax=Streptomyces TaxID=1883 RepID=UPI00367BC670